MEQVRVKLDYTKFLTLPEVTEQEREVFSLLPRGYGTGKIAGRLDVSAPRVCQVKNSIAEKLLGFFGQEIWAGYNPSRTHQCRTKNGRRRS